MVVKLIRVPVRSLSKNRLRLLSLPRKVREEVIRRRITSSAAQELASLDDDDYASRQACETVAAHGARPYFLPKTTSTLRSHGVPAWKEMMYEFVDDPQEYLGVYHMRSISETVNSMDKTRFPARIRKKRLRWRKRTEELLRKDVHNARQYSYLQYLRPELVRPMAG